MPGGARKGCGAGVVSNKIYVIGGQNSDFHELGHTLVFDITKQQWESSPRPNDMTIVPPMNTKRFGFSVVVVDHFVVAVGGGNDDDTELLTIEVLDTQRNV